MELGTRRRRRRRSYDPGPGGGEDYLSAIPDDLLLLVLARLGCASAAARTGLLSRRWRGLWARLRDLAFRNVASPSLQAALDRVARPPPPVSLLEIRVPRQNWREYGPAPAAGVATSLLRAAALLEPEKLAFSLPWEPAQHPTDVDLPYFHRATSIVLEWIPFALRAPAAGGEFAALQALSLTGCEVYDLGALLSLCPRLRVLRLTSPRLSGNSDDWTGVHSTSLQELVMETMWTHRVDIVAPMLKQLTVSLRAREPVSISILAPMLEKVSWQCLYLERIIGFGLWTLDKLSLRMAETHGQLPSLHIHVCSDWFPFADEEANFAQEIEKHMVVGFSALELHLTTDHAFGAFVLHLFGLNRIRSVIRRLKVTQRRSSEKDVCGAGCPCQPTNWRTQVMSLTVLEEVEIDDFEGEDHELYFLKLLFNCAPMLKSMIVKLLNEVSSSDDICAKIYDIFRKYSSVKCNIYISSGLTHRSQNCLLT